jgi:hypothetical protein
MNDYNEIKIIIDDIHNVIEYFIKKSNKNTLWQGSATASTEKMKKTNKSSESS